MIKGITGALATFETYRSSMNYGKQVYSRVCDFFNLRAYDVDEILKNVKVGVLNTGDRVELEGKLLRYGQVFKPYTNIQTMGANCHQVEHEVHRYEGKVIEKAMEFTFKTFQLPVQKIPNVGNIGCAFLYDSRFKTFEFKEGKKEDEKLEYKVDKYSKPIMVLYDIARQQSYINKQVVIKGEITKLPIEFLNQLEGISDPIIQDVCSNYIDPFAQENTFICINTLGERSSIELYKELKEAEGIRGALYVETQLTGLEGIDNEDIRSIIEANLSNLPQKLDPRFPLTVATTPINGGVPFISINDINIIYRSPKIIGFYTDTSLFDEKEYRKKLNDLSAFVKNFKVDYRRYTNKHLGIKSDVSLNFLFDYEKRFLFDGRGVLYTSEVESAIKKNPNLKETQLWLNSIPPTT
jgi:hypothetical protein